MKRCRADRRLRHLERELSVAEALLGVAIARLGGSALFTVEQIDSIAGENLEISELGNDITVVLSPDRHLQ